MHPLLLDKREEGWQQICDAVGIDETKQYFTLAVWKKRGYPWELIKKHGDKYTNFGKDTLNFGFWVTL